MERDKEVEVLEEEVGEGGLGEEYEEVEDTADEVVVISVDHGVRGQRRVRVHQKDQHDGGIQEDSQ